MYLCCAPLIAHSDDCIKQKWSSRAMYLAAAGTAQRRDRGAPPRRHRNRQGADVRLRHSAPPHQSTRRHHSATTPVFLYATQETVQNRFVASLCVGLEQSQRLSRDELVGFWSSTLMRRPTSSASNCVAAASCCCWGVLGRGDGSVPFSGAEAPLLAGSAVFTLATAVSAAVASPAALAPLLQVVPRNAIASASSSRLTLQAQH